MTLLEIAANGFVLASVYAARRNSVHTWWCGIIGVSLYAAMFWEAKLYADVVLQGFFVATGIAGWWQWTRGGAGGTALAITSLSNTGRALAVALAVAASVAMGYLFSRFTDAALPYADSYILGASVVAQLLMMRRKIGHWALWITVDVVAVVVYSMKALYLTAAVYALLLVLCVQGLAEWQRIRQRQPLVDQPLAVGAT